MSIYPERRKRMSYRAVVALCVLCLSACGSVPEPVSLRQSKAVEFNQRAQSAFQRGEYQTAADLYALSLQVDSSIENVDGIAINLINLARVHQAMGQREWAHRDLDAVLNERALHFRHEHLAAAAVQKAVMQLQEGDVTAASTALERAAASCTADCRLQGALDNLRAGIALHNRDADQALSWSERAAGESRKSAPVEYANALRLSAQAKLLKGDADAAKVLLEQALLADKQLGLPQKIMLDLNLLSDACSKKGEVEEAQQYRARAARVAASPMK